MGRYLGRPDIQGKLHQCIVYEQVTHHSGNIEIRECLKSNSDIIFSNIGITLFRKGQSVQAAV